jgi:hypothetical protein
VFQCHRRYGEGIIARILANKLLLALVIISIAVHVASIYYSPVAAILGFAPIGLEWIWVAILCLIPLMPLSNW